MTPRTSQGNSKNTWSPARWRKQYQRPYEKCRAKIGDPNCGFGDDFDKIVR